MLHKGFEFYCVKVLSGNLSIILICNKIGGKKKKKRTDVLGPSYLKKKITHYKIKLYSVCIHQGIGENSTLLSTQRSPVGGIYFS
jgi:hypothetical protein